MDRRRQRERNVGQRTVFRWAVSVPVTVY